MIFEGGGCFSPCRIVFTRSVDAIFLSKFYSIIRAGLRSSVPQIQRTIMVNCTSIFDKNLPGAYCLIRCIMGDTPQILTRYWDGKLKLK